MNAQATEFRRALQEEGDSALYFCFFLLDLRRVSETTKGHRPGRRVAGELKAAYSSSEVSGRKKPAGHERQ
jgi:hypothetical protein